MSKVKTKVKTKKGIDVTEKEHLRRVEHGKKDLAPYHFKPGESGNPNGRPKDLLRSIGLNIAAKKAHKILSKEELELIAQLDMKPDDVTIIQSIMIMLATSGSKDKVELFLDRTFGKVPNININAEVSAQLVTRFRAKLTDAELSRIVNGEDALEILLEKLPDVVEGDNVVDADGWEDDE